MKEVCAWCDAVMKDGDGEITHGICDPCRKQHFPNVPVEKQVAVLQDEIEEQDDEDLRPFSRLNPNPYFNQHAADVRPSEGW